MQEAEIGIQYRLIMVLVNITLPGRPKHSDEMSKFRHILAFYGIRFATKL